MSSLSAHLRRPDDHAGMAFHPECPVCRRERLAGHLPADGLVSRRTQAALAAGVLVFTSAAAPSVAVAESDRASEGSAAAVPTGDPAGSPDLDPGGPATDLVPEGPPQASPVSPESDGDDDGPLEQEPVRDVAEPVVDARDGVEAAGGQQPLQSTTGAPEGGDRPTEAAAGPEQSTANATTQAPDAEGGEETPRAGDPAIGTGSERRRSRPATDEHRGTPQRHAGGVEVTRESASPKPVVARGPEIVATSRAPTVSPAAELVHRASTPPQAAEIGQSSVPKAADTSPTPAAVARPHGNRATPHGRFHIVRSGESLWSIAADHLGDRATVARVAREVNRLWSLNRDQIATGDPDLLPVGTRLRLR